MSSKISIQQQLNLNRQTLNWPRIFRKFINNNNLLQYEPNMLKIELQYYKKIPWWKKIFSN